MMTGNKDDRLTALISPLLQDVTFCVDQIESGDSQFWRRALVRAQFALMEGTVNSMKQMALAMSRRKGAGFTIAERVALTEKNYDVDEKGRAKETKLKVALPRNVRFAFYAFAKANLAHYELKVNGTGWEAFLKVVKVRDRLMHPRTPDDLMVSDDELQELLTVFSWFSGSFRELTALTRESLTRKLSDFDDEGNPIVPNAT